MTITAAKLQAEIAADTSKLTKGLSDASGMLKDFASKATKTGLALTAGITVPAVMAAKGMLDVAMSMEQSRIAFTTLLGSAEKAGRFLNELKDFAASTPFEFTELQGASKRMLAFGFASERVLPMLRDIGDAASGLGVGSEGVNRITLALGQMQAKAKVSAQEMMQLTEAGIPAWGYLADAMGTSTAEVMKLSERGLIPAGEAIDAILAGMRQNFGGMMAAQSQTAAGQISNLKDQITFLAMEIGESMLPMAKEMIKAAQEAVKWWTELPEGVQSGLLKIALGAALIGPLTTAFGLLAGALAALPPIIGAVTTAFAAYRAGLTLTSALGAAGIAPVAVALGAVALAVAAVVAVWSTWNKQIVETNKQGHAAVKSAWNEFFDEQTKSGKEASEILAAYREKQAAVKQVLDDTSPVIRMFIKDQELLINNTGGLNEALAATSPTWGEYVAMVYEAGIQTEMLTYQAYEAARATQLAAEASQAAATPTYYLGETALLAAEGLQEQALNAEEAAAQQERLTGAMETYGQKGMSVLGDLTGKYDELKASMDSWMQDTAGKIVNVMGDQIPESSGLMAEGILAVDEVFGSTYTQQAEFLALVEGLVAEYGKTKDLAAFKQGLIDIKEQGLADMKQELSDVTTKAGELYNKLLALPEEIRIKIGFDVEALPAWVTNQGTTGTTDSTDHEYRAFGGSVYAGLPYIVGERGPELFVPNTAGTIIPNGKGGGGGDVYITMSVEQVSSDIDVYSMAQDLASEIRRARL